MKCNKKCFLIFLLLILSFSFNLAIVSASEVDFISNDTLIDNCSENINDSSIQSNVFTSIDSSTIDFNSSSNLNSTQLLNENPETYIVSSENLSSYFDSEGILNLNYGGSNLIFKGTFNNLGILTINSPNTTLSGGNFINTVFCLNGANISLSNLTMKLTYSFPYNEGSGILILNNYTKISNVFINYTAPSEVSANGIYAYGGKLNQLYGISLINNTIYFEGDTVNTRQWNYGLWLSYCPNALVLNNYINVKNPLRAVNWNTIEGGVTMDLVATVAIEYSDNLRFENNILFTSANDVSSESYPTLDGFIIHSSNNCLIANNRIEEYDFITPRGVDNYLYALDVYMLDNLTIFNNTIIVETNGGQLKQGTAYPIQVTGPVSNIDISYNNLSTKSNGPNLGIYSQNYYGKSFLIIHNNHINVTGLAGTHYWALVSGIEIQDSNDLVYNNTIYTYTVGKFDKENNIYGISYAQHTEGNHTFQIHDNIVVSEGYYAVSLLDAVNSGIYNNILHTPYTTGNEATRIISGENNTIENNTDFITINPNDPGNSTNPFTPNNPNGNGSGFGNGSGDGSGSGNGSGVGFGNGSSVSGLVNGILNGLASSTTNGTALSVGTVSASQSVSPASSSGAGSTGGDSSNSKVYEVNATNKTNQEDNNSKIVIAIVLVIVLVVLFYFGFKRGRKEE